VAIGFRAPDTQAAVNIWINSRDIQVPEQEDTNSRRVFVLNESSSRSIEPISLRINSIKPRIPNNVNDERPLLTPLFLYNVGNFVELEDSDSRRVTGDFSFSLEYDKDSNTLKLIPGKNTEKLPQEVINVVQRAAEDESFQNYALLSLRGKRSTVSRLNINISYSNGYLDPKSSFVEA
jgi:hypothetical protein